MEPPAPHADAEPRGVARQVTDIAEALIRAAPEGWTMLTVEWSQAGTQHSGRAHRVDADGWHRIDMPDGVVAAFASLRAETAAPGRGAWFSARVVVEPGAEPRLEPNPDRRPFWNSPTPSMLDAPDEPPVPDEGRWLTDLKRFPRDREHIPDWLAPDAVEGEASAELRAALDRQGVPRAAVVLPGEPEGPTFEGVLEIVRYSGAHFALRVDDYGLHHLLGEFRSERQACVALWQYLTSPLPQPVRMSAQEFAARSPQRSFDDLRGRLLNVGPGGILTNLAPGVVYDRFGGIDGLYFFGAGTSWPERALPPTANAPGAMLVPFVALRPVEIQAELVAPWFDQPGGGIRFHVEGGRAVRDLVREQVLALVDVVP